MGEVNELQDEYFDYGKTVFNMYNVLRERSETVYRRTERINDLIDRKLP